ncbi:MAG: hypothetical protein JF616_03365 [Fibrobacteres bacterium]|jgi:hypothetical protein|nr:hypothetical protein [Fibrobacterota bacterium]
MTVTKISAFWILLLTLPGFSQNFWVPVFTALDTNHNIRRIDIAPDGTIYGTKRAYSGIYWSTDRGQTWDSSSTGLPTDTASTVKAIHVQKTTGHIIVGVDSPARLYRSTDRGRTWNEAASYGGAVNGTITVIAEGMGGVLFANGLFGGFVWRSTDNGDTWVPGSLAGAGGGTGIGINPYVPGEVYSGTEIAGFAVWRSADNGLNWAMAAQHGLGEGDAASFAFTPGGSIFMTTVHNPFKSMDKGETWTAIPAITGANSFFALNTDVYMSGGKVSGGSVFRSSDDGNTWTDIGSGLPVPTNHAIAVSFSLSPDGYLYALAGKQGLYRSANKVAGTTPLEKAPPEAGLKVYQDGEASLGFYDMTGKRVQVENVPWTRKIFPMK